MKANAKCRHLKKLASKGTLPQVFICLRPRNPYPLTTYTVYSIFIHTGKVGGRVEKVKGATVQKAGSKIPR
jgi:hypothetical protein